MLDRLRDWTGQVVAVSLVDDERALVDDRLRTEMSIAFATAAGPARVLVGRIARADPAGTVLEFAAGSATNVIPASRLRLAGRHNAANALGVAGAALELGVAPQTLSVVLASFEGVGRRLERKGEGSGVIVYDDYGHHPTAIRERLGGARKKEPGKRIWALSEPLTYRRTAAMLEQFAEVLAGADGVAIADIWASRDPDSTITSDAALAAAVARHNPRIEVAAPGPVEATAAWLAGRVRPGDAVLVMGGGKSYRISELLVEALGR